jgi:hypothetical protein
MIIVAANKGITLTQAPADRTLLVPPPLPPPPRLSVGRLAANPPFSEGGPASFQLGPLTGNGRGSTQSPRYSPQSQTHGMRGEESSEWEEESSE